MSKRVLVLAASPKQDSFISSLAARMQALVKKTMKSSC
jgi:hypothetical protein